MDIIKDAPAIAEIQHKFMKINRLRHCVVEKRIGKFKLHRSEHRMLMFLNRCKETPTQKDLAEHFEISPAAVAVCLKKLESSGYIVRSSSLEDNRQKEISITDKGREIVVFSKTVFDHIDSLEFNNISDAEKKSLYEILNKILLNLEEINDERMGNENEALV